MFVIGPIILLVVALTAGGATVAANSLEEKAKQEKQETTALQEDRVAGALTESLNSNASVKSRVEGDSVGEEVL